MAGREREVQLRVPASCRPKSVRERLQLEITEPVEEYTEGIYRLQKEMEVVSTGDIAKYMSVKPPSVTTMLKNLVELGLCEHTPYQGVRLTERGTDLSIKLLRKHRLVERMLVDFLELPWDDVHDLACKLEHYISEGVADRIAKAMNFPATCPHGNPVDETLPDYSFRLSEAQAGDELMVVKITDERQDFLAYILQIGLLPETCVSVESRTPFGDVLTLAIDGQPNTVAVGRDLAVAVNVLKRAEIQ